MIFEEDRKLVIARITAKIQNKINKLHSKQPDSKVFEQEGLLNGSQIIQEYLDEGEYSLATEHLLYIFYESDINQSLETTKQLNELTHKYKIKNPYL